MTPSDTAPAQNPEQMQKTLQQGQQGQQTASPLAILANEIFGRLDAAVMELPLSRTQHAKLQQAFQDTATAVKPRLEALIAEIAQKDLSLASLQKAVDEARKNVEDITSELIAQRAATATFLQKSGSNA